MASRTSRNARSTQGNTPAESSRTTSDPPSQEQANVTLADKLEAAQRRITELEEEARLRTELEAAETQIRQLEGANPPANAAADAQRVPVVSPAAYSVRRAPKTRELPTYKGKNIKEAQDFFYQAELKWREDGDITWDTDAAKVTHCVSCFEGIARDVWKRRERMVGVDNTSWEDFVEFMKNAISDPGNRNLDAITKHEEAQQRPHQSVQSFVSYLDSLEDDLGYVDGQQRRNHLLAKLKPEIRKEINRQGEIPKDRERLIALAVRIENHLSLFNETPARREEHTGHRRGREVANNKGENRHKRDRSRSPQRESSKRRSDGVATGANSTPTPGTRGRNDVVCFKCKKEGHYATACPTLLCYNCKKPGHKAYACPQPKRQQGNDNAPQ
jgi:Zinc knuckle